MAADPELLDNLKRNNLKLEDTVDDPVTGAQAMVVRDVKTKDTFILFRGTWPVGDDKSADVVADADRFGDTGSAQYDRHKATFDKWAQRYPKSIVTGHSLGAALGQRFTADHPEAVREAVFFNAPAVDRLHAEKFARATTQPPVTIYIGGSKVPDGSSAPAFDIVSEFGGRSHLPGKIVESINLSPPEGVLGIMGANHTDFMLSGKTTRKTEEIRYQDYEERREDNWRKSEELMRGVRTALQLGDAAAGTVYDLSRLIPGARQGAAAIADAAISEETRIQLRTLGQSIAGLAGGYGATGGPSGPSPHMVTSSERDCTGAEQNVTLALAAIKGAITAAGIENSKVRIRMANERSTGCAAALAKIATAQGVIAAASGRLIERSRDARNSCEASRIEAAAREVGGMMGEPEAAALAIELRRRQADLAEIRAKIDSAQSQYRQASEAGDLRSMRVHATAVRSVSSLGKLGTCFEDENRQALNSLTRIDALAGALDRANAMLESCTVDKVRPLVAKLQNGQSPAHRAIARQLERRIETCVSNRDRFQARCLQAFGVGYTLSEISPDGKQFWCRPSQEAANSKCVDKLGAGHIARNITDRGEYVCHATQAGANRRCNEVNPGNGWLARNFKPDGTYQCFRSGASRLADATAECRAKYGRLFSHVEFRGNTTICHHCQPGTYPRNRRCVTPGQRVPVGTGQRVPAGGGTLYLCSYGNADGSIMGGGGSVSTIRSPTPIRGANCRRIR
jgi:pimeloyl-ACP methyl ester carboxylesterase